MAKARRASPALVVVKGPDGKKVQQLDVGRRAGHAFQGFQQRARRSAPGADKNVVAVVNPGNSQFGCAHLVSKWF